MYTHRFDLMWCIPLGRFSFGMWTWASQPKGLTPHSPWPVVSPKSKFHSSIGLLPASLLWGTWFLRKTMWLIASSQKVLGKFAWRRSAVAPSSIVLLMRSAIPFIWGVYASEWVRLIPNSSQYFLRSKVIYSPPPSEKTFLGYSPLWVRTHWMKCFVFSVTSLLRFTKYTRNNLDFLSKNVTKYLLPCLLYSFIICTSETMVWPTDGISVQLCFENGRFVDFAILQDAQSTLPGWSNAPMAFKVSFDQWPNFSWASW